MDFTRPPRCYEEICIWKVFVCQCEADVWQVAERWLKRFGNPFIIPIQEDEHSYEERHMFQLALQYCYTRNQ